MSRPTSPLIGVEEAAKALHVSPAVVYQAVQEGKWAHIGAHAVQRSSQWTYIIPRAMFARWLEGSLPVVQAQVTVRQEATPEETARAVLTTAIELLERPSLRRVG